LPYRVIDLLEFKEHKGVPMRKVTTQERQPCGGERRTADDQQDGERDPKCGALGTHRCATQHTDHRLGQTQMHREGSKEGCEQGYDDKAHHETVSVSGVSDTKRRVQDLHGSQERALTVEPWARVTVGEVADVVGVKAKGMVNV
jgi:hypothetical protein